MRDLSAEEVCAVSGAGWFSDLLGGMGESASQWMNTVNPIVRDIITSYMSLPPALPGYPPPVPTSPQIELVRLCISGSGSVSQSSGSSVVFAVQGGTMTLSAAGGAASWNYAAIP